MKKEIQKFNTALKDVHRRFLELERYQAENFFQRKISPFEFVMMLTEDKNFAWLRPFSSLIAEIDAFADTAEDITDKDLVCIKQRIDQLIKEDESIKDRYQHHLLNDPSFVLLHAQLKKELSH